MVTYAGSKLRQRITANVCSHMLTYGDVCRQQAAPAYVLVVAALGLMFREVEVSGVGALGVSS
jgi:hypothetical protein